MKPLIIWPGNRRSIATAIRMQFPDRYRRYYEPMVGGGSVFLAIQRRCERTVLGDCNGWLMDVYRAVRDDCHRVIAILESLVPCEPVYHRIAAIHPNSVTRAYRAAHLIYLNRLAFGHVFRVNRSGYFNVPFGKTVVPVFDRDEIHELSRRLRSVELRDADYRETVRPAAEGDLVYFDPPSSECRPFGYSSPGRSALEFSDRDYSDLRRLCLDLHDRGVRWVVSDGNTTLARMLFDGYPTTPILKSPRDGEIEHLLIRNYSSDDGRLVPLPRRDDLHAVTSDLAPGCRNPASQSGCLCPVVAAPTGLPPDQ